MPFWHPPELLDFLAFFPNAACGLYPRYEGSTDLFHIPATLSALCR
jgi:hypothetical protein